MRRIRLPEDEKKAHEVFALYYTAAYSGKGPKNLKESKSLGRLQDDLDEISHEEKTGDGSDGARIPNDGVSTIDLEDDRFELLKERMFGAEIQWTPQASRRLTLASERLDEAEEIKPQKEGEENGDEDEPQDDGPEEAQE